MDSMEPEPAAAPAAAENAATGVEEDGEAESDSFMCFFCLDLIYKPVVLECGHMSCFWCVHKSMSGFRDSSCAVCRKQYKHFPGICELLHRLLCKVEPAAYKRRAKEVYEEEKEVNCFSPQFENFLEGEHDTNDVESASEKPSMVIKNEVSLTDVLCHGCKELLFRPSVLNCGHVYCEACIMGFVSDSIKCPTCQMFHPGGLPKVCLNFDEFLAKQFPEQYIERVMNFEFKKKDYKNEGSSSSAPAAETSSKKGEYRFHVHDWDLILDDEELAHAHVGVGCDACGMYPIIGKRYKCQDCEEAVGFDLCGVCYESSSKRPGRFNQRHTPDHKFEIDDSNMLLNILKRRVNNEEIRSPEYDMEECLDQ